MLATIYRNNYSLKTIAKSFSTNTQMRLAKRPVGLPTRENWSITTEAIPTPTENDIVVKVTAISLDPAMRGWMNDAKSYIAPVGIGEVMRAGAVGEVISSKNPKYQVGDMVQGGFGVQQYALVSQSEFRKTGLSKIDLRLGTETMWLNVLGMPGMTGYFGLKDVGLPKIGETIVVSAAAGAVGQTVGQLAKILGLRVVGIAGGKEKCDWVVNTLGYDACIDYKVSPSAVKDGLKSFCQHGIDIYFDNVGGDILDTVLTRINKRARVVVCGAISQYNATSPVVGPKNYLSLLVNRGRMEGMVVFDYADKYHIAIQEMAGYLQSGQMKSKEHIVEGIEHFPEALNILFSGENFGKLVLKP
jgi:NADPH-dependent curcumin reductase CurA